MLLSVTAVFLQSLHVHTPSSPKREKGGYKLCGLLYGLQKFYMIFLFG